MTITAKDVLAAARKGGRTLPGMYKTADGMRFWGLVLSDLQQALRDDGWRNVPRFDDDYRLRKMGIVVTAAQYVGGARPTGRHVPVIFIEAR